MTGCPLGNFTAIRNLKTNETTNIVITRIFFFSLMTNVSALPQRPFSRYYCLKVVLHCFWSGNPCKSQFWLELKVLGTSDSRNRRPAGQSPWIDGAVCPCSVVYISSLDVHLVLILEAIQNEICIFKLEIGFLVKFWPRKCFFCLVLIMFKKWPNCQIHWLRS